MTYDLAVWEGPPPLSNAHAGSEYDRRLASPEPGPPSPAIEAFIDAMLTRYPEHGTRPGPWVAGPLRDGAAGTMIYFTIDKRAMNSIRPLLVDTSKRLGLVAYDPQVGQMIPSATAVDRTAEFDLPTANELPIHLNAVIGEALESEKAMAGVVEHVSDGYYIQWMARKGGLTIEAQGENVLPVKLRLPQAGRDQMMSMGFVAGEPNWMLHWDDGRNNLERAARILTDVLLSVRGTAVGAAMKLQTFPV